MTIGIQRGNLEKIQAAIAAGRAKIEAVDVGLRPEVRQERIAALRLETLRTLRDLSADLEKRESQARNGLTYWSQDAARRRAKFSDDAATDAAQRLALFETVKRAGTGDLIGYLDDAIREKSIAKAEAVRLEFSGRADAHKVAEKFNALFAAVVDVAAKREEAELQQIAGVGEFARVLVKEFDSGKPDPAGRISAARAAGMVATVTPIDPAKRADDLRAA